MSFLTEIKGPGVPIIKIREHQNIQEVLSLDDRFGFGQENVDKELWLPRIPDGRPVFLFDIDIRGNVGYYIGLDWLVENQIALECKPKISQLDYMAMFYECLADRRALEYLGQIYFVDTDRPPIPSERPPDEITTIIALHFLKVLQDLIKRPLKKNYLRKTENLTARIRGKVEIPLHLDANVVGQRPDRMYCTYQEYTTDCYENRLLHSAFDISLKYLENQKFPLPDCLRSARTTITQSFQEIGYIRSLSDLHKIKDNPLYREYGEALRLARLLYRIKGYRYEDPQQRSFPVLPYTINMSLLFELYVYAKLPRDGVLFQISGNYGQPDFLDIQSSGILDAKYRLAYEENGISPLIEDIRQLSGYARDLKIQKILGLENSQLPISCVIIYPDANPIDSAPVPLTGALDYLADAKPIHGFQDFYKVAIGIPFKSD